jgi:gluconate 2-dehydrogenase gamma chain
MPDRRDFLASSGSVLSGAWLARFAPLIAMTQACARDAMREGRPFVTFTEQEGADFDAFAARIVPSGDTPGAREAGSVHFADLALGRELSELLPIVRRGLESLTSRASEGYGAASFSELDEADQDEIVGAVEQEDPGFFFMGRTLVVLGLVTNPEYGGNRDKVGWRLIGFEDSYGHQPPFGYYDRDEHRTAAGDDA